LQTAGAAGVREALRGTSTAMRCALQGGRSSPGPRTSPRRSGPIVRCPGTGGIGRTGNAASGLDSQAGRHRARYGAGIPAWNPRVLASMHESPRGWIVPSCSSSISTVVVGRRQRDSYPQILIGWSVHCFYSNHRGVLRGAQIYIRAARGTTGVT
jgi:hypothetical protein